MNINMYIVDCMDNVLATVTKYGNIATITECMKSCVCMQPVNNSYKQR